MFSIYVGLTTMAGQNQEETLENCESIFFFFESEFSIDNTDPDKNVFNGKFIFYIFPQKIS